MPQPTERDPSGDHLPSIWLINPFDDIPGEDLPPLRYWSLARALVASGHDVTWWSAAWSHRKKSSRRLANNIQESEGFSVKLVPVRSYLRNISISRLLSHGDFGRNFRRMAYLELRSGTTPAPSIVLASLPPFESCEAALGVARFVNASFVLDIMDLWPENFTALIRRHDASRGILTSIFLNRMKRRRAAITAAADAISAPCQTYLETALANARHKNHTHICYHGSDISNFPQLTSASTVPSSRISCVYSGSLEANQDIEILPRAIEHLSGNGIAATIHVAGTGSKESTLRRNACNLKGPSKLIVHGLLEQDAYRRLLATCDVGLVCVKPESMVAMPYKAADYCAAGLATINSLPGELHGLLSRYQAGIPYNSGSPVSLSTAIESLARNRSTLAAMKHSARRMAENEFDRRNAYTAFAKWLEDIPSPNSPWEKLSSQRCGWR